MSDTLKQLTTLNTKALKASATSKLVTIWGVVKPFLALSTVILGTLVPNVAKSTKIFIDAIDAAFAEGLLK